MAKAKKAPRAIEQFEILPSAANVAFTRRNLPGNKGAPRGSSHYAVPVGFDYSSLSRRFYDKKTNKPRAKPQSSPCTIERRKKMETPEGEKIVVSNRKTCPAQLFFDSGKAYIRFCHKHHEKGRAIEVRDPIHANEVAQNICACWEKTKSFDKCGIEKHALMGLKGKRSKKARR